VSVPLLQIKNVKKLYGDYEALKGVSLDVHAGTIVGLLGPNGAGKTTLSSIVASLKPATSGSVLFEGKSIYDDIVSYRQKIGFCPQKPNLNKHLTLSQNLTRAGSYFGMSPEHTEERIKELSRHFQLTAYLNHHPSDLSGGYKQRFSLARALLHNPKVIILDEPTVALDPHIRNQLWNYIKELANLGIAVLLTTHYLDEAELLSDKVCVLDKGVVEHIDTPQNLMSMFNKNTLEEVFIHLFQE
jgi:ABC-2 type transport system ATP-binding protein